MAASEHDNLLARLAGTGSPADGTDPYAALAASQPDHDADHAQVDALLDRINQLAKRPPDAAESGAETSPSGPGTEVGPVAEAGSASWTPGRGPSSPSRGRSTAGAAIATLAGNPAGGRGRFSLMERT